MPEISLLKFFDLLLRALLKDLALLVQVLALESHDASQDLLGPVGCGVDGVAALVVQPAALADLGVAAYNAEKIVRFWKKKFVSES